MSIANCNASKVLKTWNLLETVVPKNTLLVSVVRFLVVQVWSAVETLTRLVLNLNGLPYAD